jgi:hypothetical protein
MTARRDPGSGSDARPDAGPDAGADAGPDEILSAAAAEQRSAPTTAREAADLADRYDQMMRLAVLFDTAGERMRDWAKLGPEILADPDATESEPLSPTTWAEAEETIRGATVGKHGLLSRSVEVDADALVLRATVLTYQWIDELQQAAYQTLGTIAGRAIGYLAPEVALGGAIVAAGLIETDALDRDGVAAYLNELAEANPELMDHVTTGGGLVDSLQMRALLTAGVLATDRAERARGAGLRALGLVPLGADLDGALRDAAIGLGDREAADATTASAAGERPSGLAGLMAELVATAEPVRVVALGEQRYVAYLPGPHGSTVRSAGPAAGGLQLVSGDTTGYAEDAARAIRTALHDDAADAEVMLVGCGAGGAAAVEIVTSDAPGFAVTQVVTASAPSAQAPRLPAGVRVLSLEDRSDPVALLGSLINADTPDRLTVVFDATEASSATGETDEADEADEADETDEPAFVRGGRAADRADHPELVAELRRLRDAGFLR